MVNVQKKERSFGVKGDDEPSSPCNDNYISDNNIFRQCQMSASITKSQ